MRIPLTALAISLFTLPALAQAPTSPSAVTPQGQPMAATPQGMVPVTGAQPLDEIGYDPKVKRDPYGRVIDENGKAAGAPPTETQKLRNDSARPLRSDKKMIGSRSTNPSAPKPTGPSIKDVPATNAVGAPVITPDGKQLTVPQPANPPTTTTTVTP